MYVCGRVGDRCLGEDKGKRGVGREWGGIYGKEGRVVGNRGRVRGEGEVLEM